MAGSIPTALQVELTGGIQLAADLYLAGPRPGPTLLRRTPYARWPDPAGRSLDHERLLSAGFHLLVQSVRGRFGSSGAFEPYVHEAADGAATADWIGAQPWSDGRVGMVGRSYDAAAQWLLAATGHPAVRAIAPHFGAADFAEGWTWVGGARQWGFLADWLLGDFVPQPAVNERLRELCSNPERAVTDPSEARALLEGACPWFADWWREPPGSAYWQLRTPDLDRVHAACLHIGGWFDIFLTGTVGAYLRMRGRELADPEAVAAQELVIGPWTHDDQSGRFLERDYGPQSSQEGFDLTGRAIEFFRRNLIGESTTPGGSPRASVFVLGPDQWQHSDEWHPGPFTVTRFLSSDGVLTDRPAGSDGVVEVPTAPPLPTGAGNTAMASLHQVPAGPCDPDPAEDGRVAAFRTPPLSRSLRLDGWVTATVRVTCESPVFDVAAKLVKVTVTGRRELIGDGIRRVTGAGTATVTIELGITCAVILEDEVLALEITGGNFPRFDNVSVPGSPPPLRIHAGPGYLSSLTLTTSTIAS